MANILTATELHQGNEPEELSPLLVDTINELLLKGKEQGNHDVAITSSEDVILKELFDKRALVMRLLLLSGYSYSTNLDSFGELSPNTGWDLAPRLTELVPDKLLAGNQLATRGSFSYKNFRLWVNIELTE